MKSIIFVALCLGLVYAAEVEILRNEQNVDPDGHYHYAYETGNGIKAEETGSLKNADTITAQGQYSYTSPEGEQVVQSYVADENGFQPSGSHIPVGPEVPVYIQRALAYIAAHPPAP